MMRSDLGDRASTEDSLLLDVGRQSSSIVLVCLRRPGAERCDSASVENCGDLRCIVVVVAVVVGWRSTFDRGKGGNGSLVYRKISTVGGQERDGICTTHQRPRCRERIAILQRGVTNNGAESVADKLHLLCIP